jgi:hypothetical protein
VVINIFTTTGYNPPPTMLAKDILLILTNYIPARLTVNRTAHAIGILLAMFPLLVFAHNQRRHRARISAWDTELQDRIRDGFEPIAEPELEGEPPHSAVSERIANHFEAICDHLRLSDELDAASITQWATHLPKLISPPYVDCPFCFHTKPLYKLEPLAKVQLITSQFARIPAHLLTAKCTACKQSFLSGSNYMPQWRSLPPSKPACGM